MAHTFDDMILAVATTMLQVRAHDLFTKSPPTELRYKFKVSDTLNCGWYRVDPRIPIGTQLNAPHEIACFYETRVRGMLDIVAKVKLNLANAQRIVDLRYRTGDNVSSVELAGVLPSWVEALREQVEAYLNIQTKGD